MGNRFWRRAPALCLPCAVGVLAVPCGYVEQRDAVSFLHGPCNSAFFWRENETFRNSSAIHFAHAIQHEVLLLAPLEAGRGGVYRH